MAEAVEAGAVAIEGDELRLPRRKPQPKDPRVEPARQALARAVGDAQLPEVLIEIDGLTRFSWILLGRPARSEQELVTLYAGLIGLGSDLSVAELVRMVPALAADSLGQMMLKIEAEGRLRAANDAVLGFMREHRVATLWGRGLFASADMMSLEATRYLWSARLDPRRRTYAVGTYAHVLDQWGILYDQPIVLNRRQAGAAIEGALRQRQVARLERVAVDTHGFTHFAMALAKLVGFDLCPRLAGLKKRRLYLPRGLDSSGRSCGRSWPRPCPAARSAEVGRACCGSAPRSSTAGTRRPRRSTASARPPPAIPSTMPATRWAGCSAPSISATTSATRCSALEILDLLNQGEAVHSLQRAIHNGMITAKHGRTTEELGTISGALTLLANIVMAWNTHRLQAMIDRPPGDHPDEVMSRLAPIGHKHINMRGILTFRSRQLQDRACFAKRRGRRGTRTRAEKADSLVISRSCDQSHAATH